MTALGGLSGGAFASYAHGISADGSIVAGYNISSGVTEAFRWTSGGMVGLGDLSGGSFASYAYNVSADGSTIVGQSNATDGWQAFGWTSGGGMFGLGDLGGGSFSSRAAGVSADGSVIVGFSQSANGQEAFRWTNDEGITALGDLSGGTFYSEAYGVGADGSIVVGRGRSASGQEAFRWTSGGGMVGLGDLSGGLYESIALGVSADGSTIVGKSYSTFGRELFIWNSYSGMQRLETLLSAGYGLDFSAWGTLLVNSNPVSADGRTIIGMATNSSSYSEAFRAVLPDAIALSDAAPTGVPSAANVFAAGTVAPGGSLSLIDTAGNAGHVTFDGVAAGQDVAVLLDFDLPGIPGPGGGFTALADVVKYFDSIEQYKDFQASDSDPLLAAHPGFDLVLTFIAGGTGDSQVLAWDLLNFADVSVERVALTVVPEPSSLSLLAVGGLALLRRR